MTDGRDSTDRNPPKYCEAWSVASCQAEYPSSPASLQRLCTRFGVNDGDAILPILFKQINSLPHMKKQPDCALWVVAAPIDAMQYYHDPSPNNYHLGLFEPWDATSCPFEDNFFVYRYRQVTKPGMYVPKGAAEILCYAPDASGESITLCATGTGCSLSYDAPMMELFLGQRQITKFIIGQNYKEAVPLLSAAAKEQITLALRVMMSGFDDQIQEFCEQYFVKDVPIGFLHEGCYAWDGGYLYTSVVQGGAQ
jgi:hypothetical protein